MVQDKLVVKEGEWFERYCEKLFVVCGFETKRDPNAYFKVKGIVHKFDVMAKMDGKVALVECKDIKLSPKEAIDAFVGKLKDVEGSFDSAIFMIAQTYNGDDYSRYRDYAARHGVLFFNADDLEELWKKVLKFNSKEELKLFAEKTFVSEKKRSFFKWLFQKI